MLASIRSAAVLGIDAYDVWVEVDASNGLPSWTMVGLPFGAVKESRERVFSALKNAGFFIPPRRITINLAPADTRKEGTAFDLPIALGLLVASGQVSPEAVKDRTFVAELGLDGSLRPIRGALPIARFVKDTLVLPYANLAEAGRVSTLQIAAPAMLRELVNQLVSDDLVLHKADLSSVPHSETDIDYSDVVGQQSAKRALEVAAAGGHNVLMIGPPGAGKTMLARRMPTILPSLSEEEALEVIAIHSVAGTLNSSYGFGMRPFRAPHHTISSAGLIGGGSNPRPGEVSLAHNGVLFLDEMFEFQRSTLDGLRQPLEDGRVVISRAAQSVAYPSRFTLIGAANPCFCGHLGDSSGIACSCSPKDLGKYAGKLSGPLVDRIDMHVIVGAVPVADLSNSQKGAGGDSSATMRVRVENARDRQRARFKKVRSVECNAHASGRWIDLQTSIESQARSTLQKAASSMALSARGYHRILKVARTIADLDGCDTITSPHVAEALRYRPAAKPQQPVGMGRGSIN